MSSTVDPTEREQYARFSFPASLDLQRHEIRHKKNLGSALMNATIEELQEFRDLPLEKISKVCAMILPRGEELSETEIRSSVDTVRRFANAIIDCNSAAIIPKSTSTEGAFNNTTHLDTHLTEDEQASLDLIKKTFRHHSLIRQGWLSQAGDSRTQSTLYCLSMPYTCSRGSKEEFVREQLTRYAVRCILGLEEDVRSNPELQEAQIGVNDSLADFHVEPL